MKYSRAAKSYVDCLDLQGVLGTSGVLVGVIGVRCLEIVRNVNVLVNVTLIVKAYVICRDQNYFTVYN